MKDLLKGFIQGAKHKLDAETPRDDFFNEIINKMDNKNVSFQKRSYLSRLKWISIAACLSLLLISIFLYPEFENKKPMVAHQDSTIEQIKASIEPIDEMSLNQKELLDQSSSSSDISGKENSASNIIKSNNLIKEHNPKSNIDAIKEIQLKVESNEPLLVDQKQAESFDTGSEVIDPNPSIAHVKVSEDKNVTLKNTSAIQQDLVINGEQNAKETASEQVQADIAESHYNPDDQGLVEEQSLGTFVKKGLFNIIKKKAKKITGELINLKQHQDEDQKVLALKFKSPHLEFTRTFPLGESRD